jgi:hypothetical protein
MFALSTDVPHFDQIENHPDDPVTAYSFFAPAEPAPKE